MQILIVVGGVTKLEAVVRLGILIQQMTAGTLAFLVVIKNKKGQSQAEAQLAQAGKFAEAADSPIQTRIRIGQISEEIEAEVIEGQFDLVIVGEPFQNRIFRRLTVSAAEELVAYVPCPVLIARGQPRPIRQVLLCEGGRVPLLLNIVLDLLPSLLKQVDELTVLHVMSQIAAGPGVPGWELRAEAGELIQKHTPEGAWLQEGLARLEQLNVRPEAKVRHGLIVREILAEARSGDYDLVVIGAHPAKGWQRYLLDDLAREIIAQVDRPVLVIKR